MVPQKFASVRHKAKPAAARLTPFRDDTGLVALRYEQTKQAEPPIPLPPPRNPRRLNRPPSTFTTSTAPTSPTSPIIVAPPQVPPPQEEHPLFRAQRQPRRSHTEEWKRDSGAPTSSSVTLREEGGADSVYQKLLISDIDDTQPVYPSDEQIPKPAPSSNDRVAPPPLTVSIPPRTRSPETTVDSPTPSEAQSPTRHFSLVRKLSKTFGMAPEGSKRLRKKMFDSDRAASHGETAPVRGSAKPPKSPKSPKSPQSEPPKGPLLPPGPGRFSADREQDLERPLLTLTLSSATATDNSFAPITTPIPSDSLWDDLGTVSFSNRGSIMFGSKSNPFKSLMMSAPEAKANASLFREEQQRTSASASQPQPRPTATGPGTGNGDERVATTEQPQAAIQADPPPPVPSIRVSSMDVERESQKVRSLYESGDDLNWEDGGRVSFAERLEPTAEVPSEEEENVVPSRPSDAPSASAGPAQSDPPNPTRTTISPRSANSLSPLRDSQARREYERAGGIEDWQDLDGVEIDRYGFISAKRPVSRAETAHAKPSPFSSRRRNVLTKRPSTSYSVSLPGPGGLIRPPSRKVSARSLNTYTSELSATSRQSTRSSIRSATNRLTHSRDRRWMDEAGEMLSLQAGLTGITDDEKMGKILEAQKRKEAERSEKWRKMATAVKIGKDGQTQNQRPVHQAQGQGMDYEFDTKNSKLIERTWKGIPDCWRSAAWYSFLATSAKAWENAETEDYLIAEFKRLQGVSSPDDVQIDLDVPRTVNGHIMFRRRYRGGQRLLFRVLHAISLYFPETGYVQGMASPAATLLCYFDEERTFVMLVRLWRYRGLERLYKPGFAGLMAALEEFEKRWLAGAGKDVAAKLNELSIDATAYGTRWYLTLFNLSIPFPAQLRVWDVFMLLGDCPPENDDNSNNNNNNQPDGILPPSPRPKGLDILHATSAALIHALRDVLLDSDFENAMKALTAWIPVKDEDLLMKVAHAEWRRHQGRAKLWDRESKDREKDNKGKGKSGKEKEKEKEKDKREGRDKEKGKEKARA